MNFLSVTKQFTKNLKGVDKVNQNIVPVFREPSEFYKKYSKVPLVELLEFYGFIVDETPIDDEDIVYIEQYKEFLLNKGIVVDSVPFKKEFFAEYSLSKYTSIIVEGKYDRKLTGEKSYGFYAISFYKEIKNLWLGTTRKQMFVRTFTKREFLKDFECHFAKKKLGGEYEIFKEKKTSEANEDFG